MKIIFNNRKYIFYKIKKFNGTRRKNKKRRIYKLYKYTY